MIITQQRTQTTLLFLHLYQLLVKCKVCPERGARDYLQLALCDGHLR